jgi:hypothetical protein
VDDVTWGALTLALTLLGGIWTWLAFQRRGLTPALRAAGFTLLPAAAWLTDTLQLFTQIASSVADWGTSLVFNPFVWFGVLLAGVSAGLITVSGFLMRHQIGVRSEGPERALPGTSDKAGKAGKPGKLPKPAKPGKPAAAKGTPAIDDDLAEIEALLRKRGIS